MKHRRETEIKLLARDRKQVGKRLSQLGFKVLKARHFESNYLELEGPEKWIDEVAARLGYSRQDYITSTYLALYFQKCQEEDKKPGNMVFKGRKSRLGFVAA